MKKILFYTLLLTMLCFTQASIQKSKHQKGPDLPIELLYRSWTVTKIDPTNMPTWAGLSEQAKNANLNINKKMIARGSYYKFERGGKANLLVYSLFNANEFFEVPTT